LGAFSGSSIVMTFWMNPEIRMTRRPHACFERGHRICGDDFGPADADDTRQIVGDPQSIDELSEEIRRHVVQAHEQRACRLEIGAIGCRLPLDGAGDLARLDLGVGSARALTGEFDRPGAGADERQDEKEDADGRRARIIPQPTVQTPLHPLTGFPALHRPAKHRHLDWNSLRFGSFQQA
jgi:hypothetical protein